MGTSPGASGFMSGESQPSAMADKQPVGVGEERQLAGYRIRDTRPPEERQLEETTRKQVKRRRVADQVHQGIDYAFVILYGLLGARFLLALAAANPAAGFVRFIRAITQPFFAPFVDIVPSPSLADGSFDVPVLICMLAFLLLHVALRGLLQLVLGTRPRPAE